MVYYIIYVLNMVLEFADILFVNRFAITSEKNYTPIGLL